MTIYSRLDPAPDPAEVPTYDATTPERVIREVATSSGSYRWRILEESRWIIERYSYGVWSAMGAVYATRAHAEHDLRIIAREIDQGRLRVVRGGWRWIGYTSPATLTRG